MDVPSEKVFCHSRGNPWVLCALLSRYFLRKIVNGASGKAFRKRRELIPEGSVTRSLL